MQPAHTLIDSMDLTRADQYSDILKKPRKMSGKGTIK